MVQLIKTAQFCLNCLKMSHIVKGVQHFPLIAFCNALSLYYFLAEAYIHCTRQYLISACLHSNLAASFPKHLTLSFLLYNNVHIYIFTGSFWSNGREEDNNKLERTGINFINVSCFYKCRHVWLSICIHTNKNTNWKKRAKQVGHHQVNNDRDLYW